MVAGITGNSSAMVSDGIHTMTDVVSTFVVIVGLKFSEKKPDKEHPYGHEKAEYISAIILSVFLLIVGLRIGEVAIVELFSRQYLIREVPESISIIAAVVSIAVKEIMFWYTIIVAKRTKLSSLRADAWHHRSDSLSSIGALIGILSARDGILIAEPIASIVVCIFIIKSAVDIFRDIANKVLDVSCPQETEEKIRDTVLAVEGVKDIDLLRTREFGDRIYVELEISVDNNLSLKEAHNIAHNVHDTVENKLSTVKHCMVHVNPYERTKD